MNCENPNCRCSGTQIEAGDYCSDVCREQAWAGREGCGCGHGECTGH